MISHVEIFSQANENASGIPKIAVYVCASAALAKGKEIKVKTNK